MLLHVMFALCTSQNSHMEALWLSKSQQSRKNQKQRKVFVQKKKKKSSKKKERVPFCQEQKKSLVKATGTGGAPRWHPDFEQRGRRQTKICHTKS